MKKFLLFLLSCPFLLFFFKTPVSAAGEFITSYDVVYEAQENGVMKVSQNITLENKLSNVYVTRYSLILEGGGVENIKAYDSKGELQVEESQDEQGKTHILVEFNEKVVGKGKKLDFSLTYESQSFLTKSGQVWEVTIPKLAKPEEIDNYALSLITPLNFGRPAFVSPQPLKTSQEENKQYLYFSKEQIAASGVVIAFGEFQIFDFGLTYHLANDQNFPIRTQIALPPDTNYQTVSYHQISPEPLNVNVDQDGNWLALYRLEPGQKVDINVFGQVKIFTRQENGLFLSDDLSHYLVPQEFWEQNEQIKNLAAQLKTPEKIYQYVISVLDYDYSRVREGARRLGAAQVLKIPERAICTEYTDLFIALSRAAGIPAREVNGYAHTTNSFLQPLSLVQDVLHSWPQYWDSEKKVWIQVDPTWQDTTGGIDYFHKFDLGHFAFVIHGLNSKSPPPAGSYKLSESSGKDVVISFGLYREQEKDFSLKENLPEKIMTEKVTSGSLSVVNLGGYAIYNLPVRIESEDLTLLTEKEREIRVLPPFAKVEIPVSFKAKKFSFQGLGKINVFVGQKHFEYNMKVESLLVSFAPYLLASLLALLALYVVGSKTWGLIKRKRKKDETWLQNQQDT